MPRNIKLQITSRHIEQNMSQYLPRNTTPKKHWTMKRLVLQAQVKSLSTSVVRTTDCVCKFSYHWLLLSASTFRHPACNDSITRNVVTDRFFYDNTLEIRVMSNLRPMIRACRNPVRSPNREPSVAWCPYSRRATWS